MTYRRVHTTGNGKVACQINNKLSRIVSAVVFKPKLVNLSRAIIVIKMTCHYFGFNLHVVKRKALRVNVKKNLHIAVNPKEPLKKNHRKHCSETAISNNNEEKREKKRKYVKNSYFRQIPRKVWLIEMKAMARENSALVWVPKAAVTK